MEKAHHENRLAELLQAIALSPEMLEIIETVIKDEPDFWGMSTEQLQGNYKFQQRVKEYMLKDIASLKKSIKKLSSNLNSNAVLITDKEYKHALSPYINQHAYIQQIDADFFEQLEFDPDKGTMNMKGNILEPITLKNAKTRSNLKELDLPLLRSLYSIIYKYAEKIDTKTVTIYLPTLTKHLGINIRGDKPNDLFAKIMAFEHVIGVLDNGSFYRLLTFSDYDKQTNSITFSSPYMNKILMTLQKSNAVTSKKGELYLSPHHSYLIHGTIANEKNKPAIEIVNAIVTLLHQRGVEKPPLKETFTLSELKKTVKETIRQEFNNEEIPSALANPPIITTMHKKISAIIKEIPILTEALEKDTIDKKSNLPKPKTAREKNIILERAFKGAYALLKTKTDIYKYFTNLNITEIIPTVSTMDQVIEITHTGINEDYKMP